MTSHRAPSHFGRAPSPRRPRRLAAAALCTALLAGGCSQRPGASGAAEQATWEDWTGVTRVVPAGGWADFALREGQLRCTVTISPGVSDQGAFQALSPDSVAISSVSGAVTCDGWGEESFSGQDVPGSRSFSQLGVRLRFNRVVREWGRDEPSVDLTAYADCIGTGCYSPVARQPPAPVVDAPVSTPGAFVPPQPAEPAVPALQPASATPATSPSVPATSLCGGTCSVGQACLVSIVVTPLLEEPNAPGRVIADRLTKPYLLDAPKCSGPEAGLGAGSDSNIVLLRQCQLGASDTLGCGLQVVAMPQTPALAGRCVVPEAKGTGMRLLLRQLESPLPAFPAECADVWASSRPGATLVAF